MAAVSWHQDGVTHWEHQIWTLELMGSILWPVISTDALNALWIIPGSHDKGKVNIKKLISDNGGSDKLPEAVPLLCAGDVAVCNRQMVHCSFPNRSDKRESPMFRVSSTSVSLKSTVGIFEAKRK